MASLRNKEGGAQAEPGGGRRGRKQRRAGTQGLAAASGPAALSDNRTRSTDTISKIKFKQMVGRQRELEQVFFHLVLTYSLKELPQCTTSHLSSWLPSMSAFRQSRLRATPC